MTARTGQDTDTYPTTPLASGPIFTPGQIVGGRYRIDRFLGQGGMGTVYQATHLPLDHPVALKTLRQAVGQISSSSRERFRREAKIAISLDHPNLVRVLDYGVEDTDYLVMELIDGTNVRRLIRSADRLDLTTSLAIVQALLDGLAALHVKGVIHRDIKPANVLVRRDDLHVKLSDFGLALDSNALGTTTQTVGGTPAYMAPEIATGHEASPASDIFAVGVTLFEMLTGQLPWTGASVQELWRNMAQSPPRSLADFGLEIPTTVAGFIEKCLSTDPQERFQDGSQAILGLKTLLEGRKKGKQPQRLFSNRLALVMADEALADVLAATLGATGLLAPVLAAADPTDPRLAAILGELDAILLDPESGLPAVVERFVGDVRRSHPSIVFFLVTPGSRHEAILNRFSSSWQERFRHYFRLSLDQPLLALPEMVQKMAKMIVFEQLASPVKTIDQESPPESS